MIVMENQKELCTDGLEEYPKRTVVFGNLVMVFWFALGAAACWFFYPWLGVAYLVIAVLLVYVVLRKLVCVNCYYYGKWCGLGWGKLCSVLFRKGDIKDFPKSPGLKLAPATYGMLMIVPLVLLVVSILQGFSWYKILVLILLVLVSFYSGSISRKHSCSQCKMKTICPGSAIKKNSS